MYYFSEAITDTKGNALIGYYVRCVDAVSGDSVALFADESSTPIETESGVADAAKVNSDGNAQFYVSDGKRHLDIYATDATTFIRRIENKAMTSVGMLQADSLAALSSLDTHFPAILTLSGSQGIFIFDSSDLSVEVAGDPDQSTYVAPSSDDTGASGAWVRMSGSIAVPDTPETGVVSGLGVIYNGNLDFAVTAGTYYLDGVLHSASAQSVTLDAADATHPRIDVLYLDDAGTLDVLTGTPAANPSKPAVDPASQLELTFVLVAAGATSISGVTTEDIYLEDAEWTTTGSVDVDTDSTTNPFAGTKCVAASGFGTSSFVNFADSGNTAWGGDGNLIIRIRSTSGPWGSKRRLNVQFWCDGATVGNAVSLGHNLFNFDSSNTSAYQTIALSKSLFGIAPSLEIDALRISGFGSGGVVPQFRLDNIQLQTNGTNFGGTFDQSAADARYLRLIGGTLTGDLVVPDEAYDATAWNGSLEVPTKNAVRDALEAIAPGGSPAGALLAANNLSDVAAAATSRTNLGLGTGNSPQFTAIEIGNASDTTLARSSAGNLSVEGNLIYRAGGTDVPVTDGGTGASTASDARTNLSAAAMSQTAEQISGFIASPADKSYTLAVKMAHAGTITETTTISASGTCTATFKINSTALGGTANSVSSAEQSQSHASNNAFSAGDDIVLTVSSNSSCADMSFTIKYTRTLA